MIISYQERIEDTVISTNSVYLRPILVHNICNKKIVCKVIMLTAAN